ncbi:MAG TPA: hypothetical protein VFK78_03740 [Gemmatimonadales bacterium]|nr:hypothetical protein [Gemmatimonadales bacterium]
MSVPPAGYWATNLYKDPRKRPKTDSPLRDLSQLAAGRFKRAREGVRALKHVTEQVVFLGMTWKWVWMYEVGGRKLGYLHPMASGASGTFVLSPAEEEEFVRTDGVARVVKQAVRDGQVAEGVRWCWMNFTDLDAVEAFVNVVQMKHQFLARPE